MNGSIAGILFVAGAVFVAGILVGMEWCRRIVNRSTEGGHFSPTLEIVEDDALDAETIEEARS